MTTKRIYTPEEAVESLKKLPENARKLIYSKEMRDILMKIGEKNKLHLDQIALLEAETGAVMLGFTETADYPAFLSEALNIDSKKADEVAKDVNEMLFLKIRESMKSTSQSTSTASAPPSPVAPKPPAAPAPVVPKPMEPHPADLMLTQKTVSVAPATQLGASSLEGKGGPNQTAKPEPPKPTVPVAPVASKPPTPPAPPAPPTPQPYKADPYREPTS